MQNKMLLNSQKFTNVSIRSVTRKIIFPSMCGIMDVFLMMERRYILVFKLQIPKKVCHVIMNMYSLSSDCFKWVIHVIFSEREIKNNLILNIFKMTPIILVLSLLVNIDLFIISQIFRLCYSVLLSIHPINIQSCRKLNK